VKRVRVKPGSLLDAVTLPKPNSGTQAGSGLWSEIERIAKESEEKHAVELSAVKCVKKTLREWGYEIVHGYVSVPRPFDLVVKRGGGWYLVEVKGKSLDRADEPLVFTSGEVELASRIPKQYLVCIAYVKGHECEDVVCRTFEKFQREWMLEKVEVSECQYLAYPKFKV